ncbi:MAG: hypothetical protein HKN95_02500 [Acidimicrobiia bacterium]|nr:hypothetical protein [Acidimicrobiia bacterium]
MNKTSRGFLGLLLPAAGAALGLWIALSNETLAALAGLALGLMGGMWIASKMGIYDG